jgi:hypothetical protein
MLLNLKLTEPYSDVLSDQFSDQYVAKKAEIESLLTSTLKSLSLPLDSTIEFVEVIGFSSQAGTRRAAGDAVAEVEIKANANAQILDWDVNKTFERNISK